MATGIDERKRSDGKTAYQAHVFDKRTGKRIRKTFDNKTAAKQWRTDAMAALRAGGQAHPPHEREDRQRGPSGPAGRHQERDGARPLRPPLPPVDDPRGRTAT
jgi:hypothetical protein